MAVLTISRQFGAGGWTSAKEIADRLNYRFISAAVIDKMAKEANVSAEWIKSIEKHAGDWLIRFSSKLVSSSFIDRHIGESRSDFDENKYVSFLEKIVARIAEEDNVVFLGRGSQYILQDNPNVFNVLLVADLDDRIKFLEKIWDVSRKEAEKAIQTREKRRDAFLKYFGKGHPNSLRLYHLIINTSKMSLPLAEDLIISLIKDLEGKVKKKK
ncbi:cytidylate kinase-like family protein [Deltaproteobacteria bacterium]|nr:cytidylate kinase-like family protein [Deltaproteobacteria bacterium]